MFQNLYRKIVITLIACAFALPAFSLPTSYFASSSKLASGKWVKIKVTEAGMQELTFDALRQMGFTDPSRVAVFGYPSWTMGSYLFDESLPDDLPAVPSAIYGDKLVFFGEGCTHKYARHVNISTRTYNGIGLKRNLDGNESYYFLTDSYEPTGLAYSAEDHDASRYTLLEAFGLFAKDFRERKPGSTAGGNYSAYLVSENKIDNTDPIDVYLPSYDGTGSLFINTGVSTFNSNTNASVVLTFPSSSVSFTPSAGYGNNTDHKSFFYHEANMLLSTMSQIEGNHYPIKFKLNNYTSVRPELGIDYLAIAYYRTSYVDDPAQDLFTIRSCNKGQGIRLSGLTANTRVWNVSDPLVPFEMKIANIDDRTGIVADRMYVMNTQGGAMQFMTFDPTYTLHTPEYVGEVKNQNLHSIEVPEMLIVSNDNNMEQAHRLAELHKIYTGTDVAVVNFKDVCNEFGSGALHPMAVRRMAKMLYDRNPERFKAILLMAPAARDNTGTVCAETPEQFASIYIPMLECEDPSNSGVEPTAYATDAIYGMLNDNFTYLHGTSSSFYAGKLDIKVGRIPTSDPGEAVSYINKVENYLANPSASPVYNRAIVVADGGDSNLHLTQAEEIRKLIPTISPSTIVDFHCVPLAVPTPSGYANLTKQLNSSLLKGAGFWNFIGHSGITSISSVYDVAGDMELLNPNPPFTIFSTCATLVMDASSKTLQKMMLFNPTGGMIAGVGPTRSVYAQMNQPASKLGVYGFYNQKAGATYGDIFRDGRNLMVDRPGLYETMSINKWVNTLSYNFAGDPMIPMRLPQGSVKVLTIDGDAVGDAVELNPLETRQFAGAVYTDQGAIDTSFNGTVIIEIYDANHTESTELSTSKYNSPAVDVELYNHLLQKVTLSVKNGRFEGPVCVALPSRVGDYNKVNLFAQTTDRLRSAVGTVDGVTITHNYPEELGEFSLPVITEMYALDRDFREGECLPANFTVYATVAPNDLGFLGSSDKVGNAISLVLDNKKKYAGAESHFTIDENGYGHFEMPVSSLIDGPHTLTFNIANVAGESSSRSISFVVVNVSEGQVKVENEFCTDQAVIDVAHNQDVETTGRLVITAPSGKVVFSQENASFPFTWNLTDTNGDRVASGIYSASAYFKAERHHGFAAPARVIVGKEGK